MIEAAGVRLMVAKASAGSEAVEIPGDGHEPSGRKRECHREEVKCRY